MEIKHESLRFYLITPGGEAELLYRIEGNVMSIYHTFVPDTERGKGTAEKLAVAAFDFAKEKRLKVRPDCPYIVHFLQKHPELGEYAI